MINEQTWIEVNVDINPSLLDTISNDIFSLGADGLEEADDLVKIYFQSQQWNESKLNLLVETISRFNPDFNSSYIHTKNIPFQDWTENWKENFKLFYLTDKIIIKPDWDEYQPQKSEIVITISPKMAFGTGHHETTQLVMLMLQKYVNKGQRMMDAGTGSGILAILAAQLGADEITAFDNDPVATENTKEHFLQNNINIKHNIICGVLDDIEKSEYDIIVANIDRSVLLGMPGKFIDYIKPGGKLILSGLLSRDEDKILTAYEEFNWKVIEKDQKGAWIVLVLTNNMHE
jgi:ribosomal protein L11 methyltransferase